MLDVNSIFSEQEKIQMNNYVSAYAGTYSSIPETRTDFCEILSNCWASQKENLYRAFGNKLILSKEITVSISRDEMYQIMANMLECQGKPLRDWFWINRTNASYCSPEYTMWDDLYRYMFAIESLIENSYFGPKIIIPCPNDINHSITIEKGAKISKMLGKISEAYGIMDKYEEFRLAHSRVLNTKTISGTLCLSIHPLDYMTMSDNNCNWSSCMSWMDRGCYRRGTVEMMNSPKVVVAYLTAKDEMSTPGGGTWNNKKWRTLLVTSPEIVTNIKGYPYQSEELNRLAVKWLAELLNANGQTNYDLSSGIDMEYRNGFVGKEISIKYPYYMSTNDMYNDFGSNYTGHYCIIDQSYLNAQETSRYINYSGLTQCVWCGEVLSFRSEEDNLVCSLCGGDSDYTCYCNYCEAEIDEDELIYVDDYEYCPYCVEDETGIDPVTGERHRYDNMVSVILIDTYENYKAQNIYPGYEEIYVMPESIDSLPAKPIEDMYKQLYYIERKDANKDICTYFNLWNDKEITDYFNQIK